MSITDLSTDDRLLTQLDSEPAPSTSSPFDVVETMFADLKAKVKPPSTFPFVREVAYQEQAEVQTEWSSIQIKPYGTGYWVPIEALTQAVVDQVTTRLSADANRVDKFAINEAFRRHCPEPLRCADVRDAVNQLRNKGQTVTHIIARDGIEVPDDLNLIVYRFPVADGFVLTGSEAPILLSRETGFDFLTNMVDDCKVSDRASFAIERKVGVSIIGPLELCRIVPAV